MALLHAHLKMTDAGHLTLQLFGTVRASRADQSLSLGSASARALIAYLALSPGHGADRGRVAGILWDHSDEAHARQNLRQTLHVIGRAGGRHWSPLSANRDRVALSASPTTDSKAVLETLARGRIPETLRDGSAFPDQLLAREPSRGELFESWLGLQRQVYEEQLVAALGGLLSAGTPDQAAQAAGVLLNIDPTDERAVRHLMAHYHRTGQTARALAAYEALWNTLRDEYDTEPASETQSLVVALKSGSIIDEDMPEASAVHSNTAHLRIGIAPLQATGNHHADSVARLFRAELISTLLRFRGFELVDLGHSGNPVDYRMELFVEQDREDLFLFCSVTAIADGALLWSERWHGIGHTWLSTRASVVSRLSSSLSLEISRAHLRRVSATPFGTSAFDAWLEGNMQLDHFRGDSLARARACFEQVIALAPEASCGYSSLARMLNSEHLMQPGLFREPRTHARSKEMANRAVAIDPLDSWAHLHRAWACCLYGEYDQASSGFELARARNPNDPWTTLSSALGEAFSGDVDTAQNLSRRVLSEDWAVLPFHWGFHAPIRFLAGDMAGCADAAATGGDAIINMPAWQAAAEWHDGRREAARASWAHFEALAREGWVADGHPETEVICDWFLSCFPIRSEVARTQLAEGARGAAGL